MDLGSKSFNQKAHDVLRYGYLCDFCGLDEAEFHIKNMSTKISNATIICADLIFSCSIPHKKRYLPEQYVNKTEVV